MTDHIKERPILFSAPMVSAILADQKTVTRRAIKPWQAPERLEDGSWFSLAQKHSRWGFGVSGSSAEECAAELAQCGVCPYGRIGERLWVRETWGVISHDFDEQGNLVDWVPDRPAKEIREMPFGQGYYSGHVIYGADGPAEWAGDDDGGGEPRSAWKPSIHMPRIASRILLEITGVRVERLQAISRSDIRAEGLQCPPELASDDVTPNYRDWYPAAWRKLWESINGSGSWEANPWVWVLELKRLTPELPAAEHEQ